MCECINPVCEGPSDVPLPGFSCRIHPCPLGYQCTAHPTDLYAVCCPKVCPQTCPDHMYCDDLTYGECVCEDGYHICPYNNICVKDCPDHCPQNSDCDDYTDGVCECLPGFHYDSNEDSCCAPCNHPCGLHGTCDCGGDCECEDGYHVSSLTYDCVPDCPDPCPQNRHCDDITHGLCECIPGHESDPNDPTGACCPECPPHCDLGLHSYCECGVCKCVIGYHHDSNGDCVKDCPICAEIHCPNGRIIDIDGCWTCECEPPGCPICGDHSYCNADTDGQCVCYDGFHHDAHSNCVSDCPDPCPLNSHCNDNTDGICECLPGFQYDNGDCCLPCGHSCGNYGHCGCEGICDCDIGYHVSDNSQECVPDCPDCSQDAFCNDDTNGECVCTNGNDYDSIMESCCTPCDHPCGFYGSCNCDGQCICESNYHVSTITSDCVPDCPPCGDHSYCNDTTDSHCVCRQGFHQDFSLNCVPDCPDCPDRTRCDDTTNGQCECELGLVPGPSPDSCCYPCLSGCGENGHCNCDGQCDCPDDFSWNFFLIDCVPDCPHQCPPNRHCNDFTDGQCVCDDFHVEDPDHPDDGCCPECLLCSEHSHCVCGECVCNDGYYHSPNTQDCRKVCPQCGSNSYCNEYTNGKCECDLGHYQHQETNECVKQCPLLCGDYSHCDHTTDGQCVCDEGYRLDVLLGCVKDCPFCPTIHCPHGQIMDADGCWTCECDCLFCGLHSQCDKSNGQCVCDHGYHHDSNSDCVKDCPLCDDPHSHCDDTTDGQCVCDEGYSFDLASKCMKDCPFCPAIHCPHGKIMDVDGCWTCECDCLFCGLHSQCDKSNGQCVCDHGYHHDENLDCVKDCPSCDDPHSHCDDTTDGQCVCDEGYSFDLNEKCVKECPVCAQIHCDYGKLYDADGCWTCDCEPPPVHPCYDDSECHEFGHCDGMWCKCNEGYAGDGKDVCEEDCTCRIRGDPIWDMFDGQYCVMPAADPNKRHTLTKYRMNVIDKCSFMVEVGTSHPLVDGRTLWGVTEPRFIQVWFDGIIYRFEQDSRVTINGQEIALPHTCAQNKCNIVKTENFVVLESPDCGIQVGFEGAGLRSVATIRVPGAFGEELVGMCGNCDGRMNDMKTRDGTNVDDENDRCEKISESYVADDSYDDGFGINLEHILQ